MNVQEQIDLLTLEGDAIFGFELQNPPTTSVSDHQHHHHIIRDPSLHALLLWSRRGVVTALSRPISEKLTSDPDSVVARAASSIVELARFRVQASTTLAMVPVSLVHLQDALGLPGRAIAGGPTWTVPDALRRASAAMDATTLLPDGVRVLMSVEESGREAVAGLRRPDNWRPEEWSRLVTASEPNAPWAMAVYQAGDADADADAAEIICVCHTPARNALVAEAGIWTRDDWRGKGLAPTTVAAWATLHPPETTTLFYSTAKENTASQAVAKKLKLQEFGYIWKLLAV